MQWPPYDSRPSGRSPAGRLPTGAAQQPISDIQSPGGGNSRSRWPTPSVHTPSSIIGGRSRAGQVGTGRYCRSRLRTASQPQHTQIIPAGAWPTSGNLGAESVCQGGRARRYFGEGQPNLGILVSRCWVSDSTASGNRTLLPLFKRSRVSSPGANLGRRCSRI